MIHHCLHVVIHYLIGFSEKNGYYRIRNSWASDWGEDGYIRLSLGRNTCNTLSLCFH
jgi:aminopeptidase C